MLKINRIENRLLKADGKPGKKQAEFKKGFFE
jgi:hypothetical protein